MTFDEYQKACLRTASMGLGPEIETCVRALGLCGEASEFRDALHYGEASDEIKEAGDVLWYTAALASAFGLTGADLKIGDLAEVPHAGGEACEVYALQIMTQACALAELTKKHVGHKKPARPEVVAALLGGVLTNLALGSIMNLDGIAKANVAKLQARYPAGFDVAIASTLPTQLEQAKALAEPSTVGHYPAGGFDANGSPTE